MKKKTSSIILPFVIVALSSCSFSIDFDSSQSSSASTGGSSDSTGVSTSGDSSESSESSSSISLSSSSSSFDSPYVPGGYSLAWSDEFAGSALDSASWEHQIGNGSWGWGNGESEYYTASNDAVTDGNLVITAKKETMGGQAYTSTRIRTYQKVSTTYGYIEAKIKLPPVQGMWPAFWMLPENSYQGVGWPGAGEIDIMENRGRVANVTSGALHYASDGTGNTHTYKTAETSVGSISEWHVYALLWTEEAITWFVDGSAFLTVGRSTWNSGYGTGDSAPFNAPFHLILNLAIGGQFDNWNLPPSDFEEATMSVDYVRIYAQ